MKNVNRVLIAFAIATSVNAYAGTNENSKAQEKSAQDCQAPSWAIAIGHEQKWKLHNGCPTDEAAKQNDKDMKDMKNDKDEQHK